jgi:hypothetical protein
MKEKKEKPLIFRMRAYVKSSQNNSFHQVCKTLCSLQHYVRTSCVNKKNKAISLKRWLCLIE